MTPGYFDFVFDNSFVGKREKSLEEMKLQLAKEIQKKLTVPPKCSRGNHYLSPVLSVTSEVKDKKSRLIGLSFGYRFSGALKELGDAAKAYSEEQLKDLKEELEKMDKEESKVKKFKYVPAELNDEDAVKNMISGKKYYNVDGTIEYFFEKGFFKETHKRAGKTTNAGFFSRNLYNEVECTWRDDLDSVKLPVLLTSKINCGGGLWLVTTREQFNCLVRHHGSDCTLLTKAEIKKLLENAPE